MNIKDIQKFIKNNCFINEKIISYRCRKVWWEKNNKLQEYNFINNYTQNLSYDIPFAGKIWHIFNELQTDVICNILDCNNAIKWTGTGYGKYCSHTCSANSHEGKKQRSKTLSYLNSSNDAFQLNRKESLNRYWSSNDSIDRRKQQSLLLSAQHQETNIKEKIQEYFNTSFKGSDDQKKRSSRLTEYNKSAHTKNYKKEIFYNDLNSRFDNISPQFTLNDYKGVKNNKYGWRCNTCNNNFVDHINNGSKPICPTCFPNHSSISKQERELSDFIESLGLTTILNSRDIISPKEIDIYVPSKSIAFEFNGSYWHSENNGKGKYYHLNKSIECSKKNIHLIHIWDFQWENQKELIKNRIKAKLCLNSTIYARKTICKKISINIKQLLNDNHIQGYCNSPIQYGLFHNNELVSIMSFTKSRYNNQYEYELLRFCNIGGQHVVGGAGKLFKHFLQDYDPTSIISYSDKSWNAGGVYKQIGFEYSHSSSPSYKYTNNYYQFDNRIKFQKHKLSKLLDIFDPELTEWQNMKNNNYDRIWDCGNDVWTWKK